MNGFYKSSMMDKVKFFDELQGKVNPEGFQIVFNLVEEFLDDKTVKQVIFYLGDEEFKTFETAGCYNKTTFSDTNVKNKISISDNIVCIKLVGKIEVGTLKEVTSMRQHDDGRMEQSNNMTSISCVVDPTLISVTKTSKTSYRAQFDDIKNFDDGTTLHVYVPESYLIKE